jgi:hypothetical protein
LKSRFCVVTFYSKVVGLEFDGLSVGIEPVNGKDDLFTYGPEPSLLF